MQDPTTVALRGALRAVEQQRNDALNRLAAATGDIDVLRVQLAEAEQKAAKVEKLEQRIAELEKLSAVKNETHVSNGAGMHQ